MNKLKKALSGLSLKDRDLLEPIFKKLMIGDTKGLDVVPIKGTKNKFRIKKGVWRVFATRLKGTYLITELKKRNEKTYK